MGSEFYGRNGKTFSRSVYGGDFLAKITVGLWDTIGCYPKSKEDCELVARILRNRIHLNQYYGEHFKIWDIEKEDEDSIEFMKELAEFFETCGGCMEEDEFYDKYGVEEVVDDD